MADASSSTTYRPLSRLMPRSDLPLSRLPTTPHSPASLAPGLSGARPEAERRQGLVGESDPVGESHLGRRRHDAARLAGIPRDLTLKPHGPAQTVDVCSAAHAFGLHIGTAAEGAARAAGGGEAAGGAGAAGRPPDGIAARGEPGGGQGRPRRLREAAFLRRRATGAELLGGALLQVGAVPHQREVDARYWISEGSRCAGEQLGEHKSARGLWR